MSMKDRFSSRVPLRLRPNALTRLRQKIGAVPFDLTVSNPTRCDLPYSRRAAARAVGEGPGTSTWVGGFRSGVASS